MIVNRFFITLLLCLFSTIAIAEDQQDPAKESSNELAKSVEEIERQNIITELSYHLDTKLTCRQKLIWSDKGSGADLDGFFFTPLAESSYYIIGGSATRKADRNSKICVISVRQPKNNPAGTPELLLPPGDWSLIWTDKGSGANTDGSMWNAVPPVKGYKCLGSVIQKGYKKPVLSNYRCVYSGLTKETQTKSIIWTNEGSGADRDVTVFKLPNSKSFVAVGRKINKVKTYDLNDTASVEPDAAVVEKLLAQRMEEINKNEEAEKERLADEEEKKRLVEAAVSKRIAERKSIAESKRIAEEKRVAEEVKEQKRLATEVEKQKRENEAEKKRIAEKEKEQEQKRLAVAAKQEVSEQETEDIQAAEKSEPQSAAEVVVAQQADVNVEINQQQAIEKTGKKASKAGLKILSVFILLLLLYAAYKVFKILIDIIKGDK